MPVRSCRVTIQDMDGVSHTVEVTAATLYEAVAQGLAAIRGSEWVAGIAQGVNVVKVSVADVRVEHVQVARLIFLVPCAGVIDISKPIKCELAVAGEARRRRTGTVKLVILLITGAHAHRVDEAAPAGHVLHGGVRQARP